MYVKVISKLLFLFLYLSIKSLLPPVLLLPDWCLAPLVNITACLPYLGPEHEGCLPTHVDVTVLMKEEPCHLLAVKLDVVLHVLHWGLLLLGRRVS